jgi:hypothetical protein
MLSQASGSTQVTNSPEPFAERFGGGVHLSGVFWGELMPQQEVQHPSRSAVAQEEVYAELEQLVRSPLFNRSEKLQRFLRFVCETTVQGGGSQINEYLIGSEVFKRGSDYNPSEDSIVRRHAHAMRQKLQEYYATEGADHAVRIEMPVGRYVPVFRRKEDLAPEPQLPPPPQRPRLWLRPLVLTIAAVAIFAFGWAAADLRSSAAPRLTPAMREIWSGWIGSEAVLCFSNPMSAGVRQFVAPLPPDAIPHSVRAHADQEAPFREKFSLPGSGAIYFVPTIAQTMMGEASAATHLASFFARTGAPLRTMETRFLSWENLRLENHILLAGDVENRWVDTILAKYPFRLANPADGSPRSIVNTAPNRGEADAYRVVGSNDARDEYALISMIPGVGPNRQLLLICGLNSPAAPLAAEYLTTEQGLQQLLKRLHEAAPKHSGPWRFQAVIKADVHDKVPTAASIIALRVL